MLKRIVDTDDSAKKALRKKHNKDFEDEPSDMTLYDLQGHSYGRLPRGNLTLSNSTTFLLIVPGITSDPLTQFAVVFSSIIHDAEHPGVTNSQLVDEKSPLAKKYKYKSVAEQNSVDRVWAILVRPEYADLRQCIYTTEEELRRFRQVR